MLAEAEGSCGALAPRSLGVHLLVLDVKVADGDSVVGGDCLVGGAVRCVAGKHCNVARILALLVMMVIIVMMVMMVMKMPLNFKLSNLQCDLIPRNLIGLGVAVGNQQVNFNIFGLFAHHSFEQSELEILMAILRTVSGFG